MTQLPSLVSVLLCVAFVILLGHFECFSSIVSEEECKNVTSMEIRYNQFYELYLGDNPKNGELQRYGIVYRSLVDATNACCSNMPLKFTQLDEIVEILVQDDILYHHRKNANNSNLVFYFPEFTKQGDVDVYSRPMPFVKLRKSPGFALVMLKSESHLNLSAADILLPSWPIFALVLALSLAVGILGWAFDNFTNPQDFPRPFIRGMFSGFWWAIVTMSTVGYGDKTPKSYPARILAVIWILAGAILLSLFTANATSIITTSRIEQNGQTMGKKIGVVNMLDFVESALNLGAHLIEFSDVQAALKSLRNKTIDKLLFPHYLDLLYLMSDKEPVGQVTFSDLYIAKVFDKPFQIGMVLSHGESSVIRRRDFYSCIEIMTSRFSRKFDYDYSKIDKSVANFSSDTFDNATALQFLYGILGIIGMMLIIGFIFDVVRYFRKRGKKSISTDVSHTTRVVPV